MNGQDCRVEAAPSSNVHLFNELHGVGTVPAAEVWDIPATSWLPVRSGVIRTLVPIRTHDPLRHRGCDGDRLDEAAIGPVGRQGIFAAAIIVLAMIVGAYVGGAFEFEEPFVGASDSHAVSYPQG